MLQGRNIIVLDLETQASASDCRHCGRELAEHERSAFGPLCVGDADTQTVYEPIGWNDHAALGLSIGCIYNYATDSWGFFDQHTLAECMQWLVGMAPLIVSFNGRAFDARVMEAVYPGTHDCLLFLAAHTEVWDRSYDVLHEIWQQDPDRKFERGLNSLDACSLANGYGRKEMDGAEAPRRWREGRYAEVLTYCMGDVMKTRRLFEQIVATGQILRGDRRPITLPIPAGLEVDHAAARL